MKRIDTVLFCGLLFFALAATAEDCGPLPPLPTRVPAVKITVTKSLPGPVITVRSDGAKEVSDGFEGGTVVKVGNEYHAFMTEMMEGIHTRLSDWVSSDGHSWHRLRTVFSSSQDFTGKDRRAALWAFMPVYDKAAQQWNGFYVAYRAKPDSPTAWYANYDGEIVRAVSQVKGLHGIDGPYRDVDVTMRPGPNSDTWEGLQGDDSFYPYRADGRWFAFYGTAHTEKTPGKSGLAGPWQVGLASSASLAGPWKRCTSLNPVPLQKTFTENPVVIKTGGVYLAVYDVDLEQGQSIGYTTSLDGVHWNPGEKVLLFSQKEAHARTPLALIPRGDGSFDLFVTARPTVSPDNKDKRASAEALYWFQVQIAVH